MARTMIPEEELGQPESFRRLFERIADEFGFDR